MIVPAVRRIAAHVCAAGVLAAPVLAAELQPVKIERRGAATIERYSERTLVVAIEVDRNTARLVAYTLKDRPFEHSAGRDDAAPSGPKAGKVQVEVTLEGPGRQSYTRRIDVRGLCLDHDPSAPDHIAGDTIQLHRDSMLVELPDVAGFDRLVVARHEDESGYAVRRELGALTLEPERFVAAGGTFRYSDLAAATSSQPASPPDLLTPGNVHWPEEYGDSVRYSIYGSEQTSDRINVVLIPDGYVYAEKNTMIAHAESLVSFFRTKTPYKEHDPFINYILVFAYSTQSGTDQCDCNIVSDTAMRTRFPNAGYPCGDSGNRCLYYGTGNGGPNCDPVTSSLNVSLAELRAPARDQTLIMVNTARYGGCGGGRAVYAAANGSALEIAAHELGHSLAGLADEYGYTFGCGTSAGEVNTSLDPDYGAWPEWIDKLGPPKEGGQYYSNCVYRPSLDCDMRALGYPFCDVCNQQWALTIFGHYRVEPTAPVSASSPPSPTEPQAGAPVTLDVTTRFALAPATNAFTWYVTGPGYPEPTPIATTPPPLTTSFVTPGSYDLTLEVIADTNFVQPSRNGWNTDYVSWTVGVVPVPEVSAAPTGQLLASRNGSGVDLDFESVGASRYNLYVSTSPATAPFEVALSGVGARQCDLAGLSSSGAGRLTVSDVSLEAGLTGPADILFFLVTADNGAGTEGSLGVDSASVERTADAYCSK